MNRRQELELLKEELEGIEPVKKDSLERAKKRRRRSRVTASVFGSCAMILAVFIITVNTVPKVALACMDIPILKNLMEVFSYSMSLSEMIERDYVQYILKEETKEGITVHWDAVIADTKQIHLVYRIESEKSVTSRFKVVDSQGNNPDFSSYDVRVKNLEYERLVLDYQEKEIPDCIDITLQVFSDENAAEGTEFFLSQKIDRGRIGEATIIEVNSNMVLGENTLWIDSLEIYPTHTRIHVMGEDKNEDWITGISYYFETKDGEKIYPIREGIIASREPGLEEITTFRGESLYFYRDGSFKFVIEKAFWLAKEEAAVELAYGQEPVNWPKEVEFISLEWREDRAVLTYRYESEKEKTGSSRFRIWELKDEKGEYMPPHASVAKSENEDGIVTETVELEKCPADGTKFYLIPEYTDVWRGEETVVIHIP